MNRRRVNPIIWLLKRLFVTTSSAGLTVSVFLILPLMQVIGHPPGKDLMVRPTDVASLRPPPPPPPEPQEEEQEEPPEQPPELNEEAPPLDLSQLELALSPGFGEGLFGDFSVNLMNVLANAEENEDLSRIFSLDELDQRPRVLIQTMPRYPAELRRQNRESTVHVVFLVDQTGRVREPVVEKSTDPAFDRYAVEAVKQWKFEPGTRKGEKVQFRMRIPITFSAG